MKGGSVYRSKGKHFTFTLLAVICMTVLLWSYEKKPLSTTLFSSQEQFILPVPGDIGSTSHISEKPVVEPEHQTYQESPNVPEETEDKAETEDKTATRIDNVDNAEETEDKAVTRITNVDNAEETEDKTATQITNVDNAEETEDKGKAYTIDNVANAEEVEDKAQPHTSSALNAESVAEESSVTEDVNSASSERKACNYAKGRWVVDNRRPLYSGFKCKQWLSEMWACRLTQRPDFGYEAYRWQPKDCDMPEFERSAFLKRMQDKTIAFVGDSLGRQQFQSLMCMVTGGEETNVQDVGREYGLITPHGAARPNGWAFRFPETNTTILYYWSSCLCDLVPLDPTDPKSQVAMHLDRPPSFLVQFLDHFDVLILNTGHHWNRGKVNANRWVMHVDGKPNEDRKLAMIGNAKSFTIHSTTKWVDLQLPSHPRLKAFFRSISPRHFFNGEWNTGGSCENTTPLARGSVVDENESSDQVIASAVKGTKVNLLDITALSQLRDEGHISRYSVKASSGIQDCLHWCLPGIPDTWNEILAAQI